MIDFKIMEKYEEKHKWLVNQVETIQKYQSIVQLMGHKVADGAFVDQSKNLNQIEMDFVHGYFSFVDLRFPLRKARQMINKSDEFDQFLLYLKDKNQVRIPEQPQVPINAPEISQ